MDKILKEKWVEALRSGKYTQGKRFLKQETSDGGVAYCCLGVLGECYDPEFFYSNDARNKKLFVGKDNLSCSFFYEETLNKLGLDFDDMCSLTTMNDVYNKDFNYIAEWVEEKL